MNRPRMLLGIIGILLLTGAAYWPALRSGFIWDDDDHFTQNRAMTAPDGLRQIWSSLAVSRYYPLTLTTFWVQRRLWGLNPLPYHAVNIALHGVNAVLAWFVLRRLNVRGAWVAAALWAVHPVNVESVAWVTELKNVQSGMFFFLALLTFFRFERGTQRGWYALSLVCFAAALLSKPSTVVLPVVLLLCAWWQRDRWTRKDFTRLVPFFVLAAAMSLLTITEQRGQIDRAPQDWSLGLTERLAVAGRAIWFYAAKVLWPAHLVFVYPRWEIHADSLVSPVPLLAVGVMATVLWRWRSRDWGRACVFASGCFIAALLPVLGFLDIYYFRYSFVADHFQYLACLAVIGALTAGVAHVLRQRMTQTLAAAVTILAAGTLAWNHAHVFHDNETLWRDTMENDPRSFLAYNNLGIVLNGRGEYAQSEKLFRNALELKPHFLEAHSNLGLALTGLGRYAEAERELIEALRIQASWSKAHYCLGRLYYLWKRPADSEREFRLAILAEPTMAEAQFNLGVLLQDQHRRAEARECYEDALRIRSDFVRAHGNLANMLAEDGQTQEAFRHYQLALQAAPNTPELHYNFGLALQANGQLGEAIVHLRKAVALRPGFADAYLALGKALAHDSQYTEAIRVFRRGLEVEPAHMVMGNEMAWIMATAPDPEARFAAQAIQIGERLAELTSHQEPKPLDTLAAAYAEAGRFDEAVATACEAIAQARAHGQTNLAVEIEVRMKNYEVYQPYRVP